MERTTVIGSSNLSIGYRLGARGRKRVHDGLSFALRQGELTCLLGPNGAGKSTLLRTLGGTQRPLDGEILLQGRPLQAYTEQQRSTLVGVVLTDKTYAGGLRVRELVALGRQPYTGFFGRLSTDDLRIVGESMDAVDIGAKADSYVSELSDGERQKTMIAKVLAQQCPVILLDEPTAFLDIISRIEVMNLLHRLARTQRKTILLSTHDIEQALLLSDRLWLLSRRDGLRCGTTEDLVLDDSVDRFFGRGGIAFDKLSGSFRHEGGTGRRAGLRCDDPQLLFWAKNALLRNGFLPDTQAGGDAPLQIAVRAADDIEISAAARPTVRCESFGRMVEQLNEPDHG